MNKTNTTNLTGILAGIIFLTGITLSALVITQYPASKRQHAKDLKTAAKLDKLELKFSELEKQISPLARLNYDHLPAPKEFIKNLFGNETIENLEQTGETLGNGYTLNKINLTAKNINLEKLPQFIRLMESQRPPVKLISCDITASTHQPGNGTVTLELERIER